MQAYEKCALKCANWSTRDVFASECVRACVFVCAYALVYVHFRV